MKTKLKKSYKYAVLIVGLIFTSLYLFNIFMQHSKNISYSEPVIEPEIFVESLSGNFLAGNYLFRLKDQFVRSANYYKQAIEFDRSQSQILLENFYIASLLKGDFGKTLPIIQQYRRDPSTITGNIILSLLATKENNFDQAIALLQKPTEVMDFLYLNPYVKNLLISLCYIGKGDYDAAQKLLKPQIKPNSSNNVLEQDQNLYLLAIVQDLAKLDREAEANFLLLASKTYPIVSVEKAYLTTRLLSNLQYRNGKSELAKATINNFIQNYPFVALGDADDAKIRLINTPAEAMSFIFLEFSYILANKAELSLICLQLAHDLNPNSDIIARELGSFFEYNGHYALAITSYQKISSKAKFYLGAQARIALNLYQLGEVEQATSMLTNLTSNEAKVILAEIYRREFLFVEAIATYNSILANVTVPTKPYMVIYELIGDSYATLKDYQHAKQNWQKALALYPDSPNLLNKLGYTELLMGGNLTNATKLIKQALDADPNNPAIQDSYGYSLYLQKQYKEALSYFLKAVISMPDSYEISDHLGNVLWYSDKKSEAILYWSNAKDQYQEQLNKKLILPDDEFINNLQNKIEEGIND